MYIWSENKLPVQMGINTWPSAQSRSTSLFSVLVYKAIVKTPRMSLPQSTLILLHSEVKRTQERHCPWKKKDWVNKLVFVYDKVTHNTSCALLGCNKQCMPPIDLCQQTVETAATLVGLWCITHHSRAAEGACQWVIFFFFFVLSSLSSHITGWRVRSEKLKSQKINLSQQLRIAFRESQDQ